MEMDLHTVPDEDALCGICPVAVHLHVRDVAGRYVDVADLLGYARDLLRSDRISVLFDLHVTEPAVRAGQTNIGEPRAVRQGYDDLCGAGDADNADPRMILAADCLDQIFVRLYLSGRCLGEGCLHLPGAGYGRVTVQPELAVFKVQQFIQIIISVYHRNL